MRKIIEIKDYLTRNIAKNSELDEETCAFYAKRTKGRDKWKNSPVSPRQCRKCHGRGTLTIDQPQYARQIKIACSCVEKTIGKHKVDMDKLYD